MLAEILGNGQRPHFNILESDEGGLRPDSSAELGNGYQLVYNHTFSHGKGSGHSYSIFLRPDFSLMKDGQPLVVFDAKFRFDKSDLERLKKMSEKMSETTDKAIDEEMDDAQQEGDIERLAKHADICKMHTYRDALKCRAATILFPGTKGVFYRTDGTEENNPCLSDIVQNNDWEGVGALPLVPKRE
jgi:predicted component of viral defense system (DUF524 family)